MILDAEDLGGLANVFFVHVEHAFPEERVAVSQLFGELSVEAVVEQHQLGQLLAFRAEGAFAHEDVAAVGVCMDELVTSRYAELEHLPSEAVGQQVAGLSQVDAGRHQLLSPVYVDALDEFHRQYF